MSDIVELLVDVFPGIQVSIAEHRIDLSELKRAIHELGGQAFEPISAAQDDFSQDSETAPILVPRTNLHVRLPAVARALLQLIWSAHRFHQATGDFGDMFNISDALGQLRKSIQLLNVEQGELCVCLATGQATVRTSLIGRMFPTTSQIAEILKQDQNWCNPKCRYHSQNAGVFSVDDVRTVLQSLQAKGNSIVKAHDDDKWSVTI